VTRQNLSRMSGWRKVIFRGCKIGFVFQAMNLLPSLTAAEIRWPADLIRRPTAQSSP